MHDQRAPAASESRAEQPNHSVSIGQRARRLREELIRLVAARDRAEASAVEQFEANKRSIASTRVDVLAKLAEQFEVDQAAIRVEFENRRQSLAQAYEADQHIVERQSQADNERLRRDLDLAESQSTTALQEARWLAQTVFDAKRKQLKAQLEELEKQIGERLTVASTIGQEAGATLNRFNLGEVAHQTIEGEPPPMEGDLKALLVTSLERAAAELERLKTLSIPSFLARSGWFWLFAGSTLLSAPVAGYLTGGKPALWILCTVVAAVVITALAYMWLHYLARRDASRVYSSLQTELITAQSICHRWRTQGLADYKRQRAKMRDEREADLQRASQAHEPALNDVKRRRARDLPQVETQASARLNELHDQFEANMAQATAVQRQRQAALDERLTQDRSEAEQSSADRLVENEASYADLQESCLADWQAAVERAGEELASIWQATNAFCPDFDSVASAESPPPMAAPRDLRFGTLRLRLDNLTASGPVEADPFEQLAARDRAAESHSLVADNDTDFATMMATPAPASTQTTTAGGTSVADSGDSSADVTLPATLDFPEGASLYIKATGRGREQAVELLRVVMLRMLTSLPPGKLRFTIVDAVGLGQNFAAFMHLADHDEALVSHRIWTEPHQIEQRLADLTEHMETVIQKYLRDEFPTIEAYNEQADEIAEPFRALVVANFPAGFNESSARRLMNVVINGPRCGVLTLISVDSKLPLPPGVDLAELRKSAVLFNADSDGLTWLDPDFRYVPLGIDALPPPETFKRLMHTAGAGAVGAKRVEVPFEAIAPAEEDYWKGDSRREIDVPLGRAGATRLEHLRLGHGTAQHVLIAGKTGSGKSTLLHALITNAALRYSPDELELYLIDFKKGVEFKTYVTHRLPHARVVAIESEREFGLSVMQRLDFEMQRRGDMFRDIGVQDIGGARDSGLTLPRILFIVDEFQEFFVEDDKQAQEASLLLDRLVRQGRAFGIHVHLGTQTLGGAYTLARSTLGQMAVRIALQCSEADAHLILNEDNSAARLLARPGEAIYNDANGRVEGNHPFQIVWLPDQRREIYLQRIRELANANPALDTRPQIVFEGAAPASLEQSDAVAALVAGSSPLPRWPRIWLGEPLAIQETTSLELRRRAGANLLWLGQNDAAVAGMVTAAVVSLAAQVDPVQSTTDASPLATNATAAATDDDAASPTADAQSQPAPATLAPIWILDGGGSERPYRAPLDRLAKDLPDSIRLSDAADTPTAVAAVHAEVTRRMAVSGQPPAMFFVVLDIAQLRELRRREEEYSFSRRGEAAPPQPDRQFAEILREGPAVGVYTLLWCDTLTNFNRIFERQSIKQFEARVLCQMSANDSSLLIDSPVASRLGHFRALLHLEDEGKLEKFRPFSAPGDEWLDEAARQIAAKPSA